MTRKLDDAEVLREMYEQRHMTQQQMAAELGVNKLTVMAAMKRHGIATRTAAETRRLRGSRSGYARSHPLLYDEAWLRHQYEDQRRSLAEMAAELGCGVPAVMGAMDAFGIARRNTTESRLLRGSRSGSAPIFPLLHDEAWLRSRYQELGSLQGIAEELGCSSSAVTNAFARFGIPTRPRGANLKGRRANNSRRQTRRFDYHSGYKRLYLDGHVVAEHRHVAEHALGRPLRKGEHVHHLNLRRDDNRPENLVVFPDNRTHKTFHARPPSWVPRCPCCGQPRHGEIGARPAGLPMAYDEWPEEFTT